jgi:hypothetical protein
MRFINRKTLAVAGIAAALVAVGSTGTAVAGALIGSEDIKNESIRSGDIKDGNVRMHDLSRKAVAKLRAAGTAGTAGTAGKDGVSGKDGKDGKDGVHGLYYATAFYNGGDTNAGAIATVACKNVTDHALSGGVQVLGLGEGANARNTPVSSSFPGRMDWATNTPKAGRTDGWIVQFGGNANRSVASDVAPEMVKVWALCMTSDASLPIEQTFQQVG